MKAKKEQTIDTSPAAVKKQEQLDKTTQIIAIAVVFIAVFYFFIKLLFL